MGASDETNSPDDRRAVLRERARTTGRATLLGAVLGVVGVAVLVATGETLLFASEKVFAVGALILGFAVLGWSGSIFAGRGIENAQEYLDTSSNWSEAASRRAMVVLTGLGAGVMVGSIGATVVLDAVV
ncbi:DUF7268 family protein [Halorussus halophilus]|uniref:DUF7268 family protein n=1 Tax=Halorussus halophilus TaxID=2650975 RepID=UPI001787BC16|nr:hypothetical protein [Halorussus halophilus]